jgi:hypothetical protein
MLKRLEAVRAGHRADVGAVRLSRGDGQWRHMTSEAHDVFVVIGKGADGERVARTVFAGSEDDARQTHQENYADELIVAVHQ